VTDFGGNRTNTCIPAQVYNVTLSSSLSTVAAAAR